MVEVPRFEVDPLFPKPLPNKWYQGQTIGLGVDAQDHVWIVHRSDSLSASRGRSRQQDRHVLRRGATGSRVRSAGKPGAPLGRQDGPGYQWPASNHGITVDKKGNVWIGGNGAGNDGHVVKFTKDGKFLMQIGIKRQGLTADSNSWSGSTRLPRFSTIRKPTSCTSLTVTATVASP